MKSMIDVEFTEVIEFAFAATAFEDESSSLREAASTVPANGKGASPLESVCSHDNNVAPNAVTDLAARGTTAADAETTPAPRVDADSTEPEEGTPAAQELSAEVDESDDATAVRASVGPPSVVATGAANARIGDLGAGVSAFRRCGVTAAAPKARPLERVADGEEPAPGVDETTFDEDPRPMRRDGTTLFVEVEVDAEPRLSAESDPTEPAEPVVSATAIGIAAVAQPIPNATANAPTRPT